MCRLLRLIRITIPLMCLLFRILMFLSCRFVIVIILRSIPLMCILFRILMCLIRPIVILFFVLFLCCVFLSSSYVLVRLLMFLNTMVCLVIPLLVLPFRLLMLPIRSIIIIIRLRVFPLLFRLLRLLLFLIRLAFSYYSYSYVASSCSSPNVYYVFFLFVISLFC